MKDQEPINLETVDSFDELEEGGSPSNSNATIDSFDSETENIVTDRFTVKIMIKKMKELVKQSETNEMNVDLYTDVYKEWIDFMQYFGKIISIAFSDI